jgi:hypothetical protein
MIKLMAEYSLHEIPDKRLTPPDLTEADKQNILNMTTTVQDNWNKGIATPISIAFRRRRSTWLQIWKHSSQSDAIRNFANAFPDLKLKFSIAEIMGSSEYAYLRGGYALTTVSRLTSRQGKISQHLEEKPEKN